MQGWDSLIHELFREPTSHFFLVLVGKEFSEIQLAEQGDHGVGSIIGSSSKVSLTKILTFRPHLNEIECWALLGQTAHALQDVLLKANGRFNRKISSNNGDNRRENSNLTLPAQCCPIVYPDRLLTSTTGKIILDNSSSLTLDCQNDFIHPLLGSTTFIGGSSAADNNPLYR